MNRRQAAQIVDVVLEHVWEAIHVDEDDRDELREQAIESLLEMEIDE